ncbi:hypothetical protein TNCV_3669021 [Trichonephila clavipes]|nr:hypothetical protein TNCV_3669021 [Trichonephila clavipes]
MSEFEEGYPFKEMQCSRSNDNIGRRNWGVLRMSDDGKRQRNCRNEEVVHRPNDTRNSYRGNYESSPQRSQKNQGFERINIFDRDNQRLNTNNERYQSRNRDLRGMETWGSIKYFES